MLTLPAAAAVGGGALLAAGAIGGEAGVAVVGVGGLVPIALLYARARRNRVDATNVNDEWSGSLTPARGSAGPTVRRSGGGDGLVSDYVDLATLGQLVLVSLAGGVGLVALFALGVRAYSRAADGHRTDGAIVAVVSLAGVVAGVVAGLYVLLSA